MEARRRRAGHARGRRHRTEDGSGLAPRERRHVHPTRGRDHPARPVGGNLRLIEVVDHGCGIDAESAHQIFERFARTDEARARDQEGTGLGLAIVDAIAKAHGGECAVRSSGGETVFALRLPGFLPEEPQEEPDPEISELPPTPAFR